MIQLLADTLSSSQSGGPKKAPSTSQSRISTKSPVHEVETESEGNFNLRDFVFYFVLFDAETRKSSAKYRCQDIF